MEKDGPLDAENITKIIKTAKRGKSHQKKYFQKRKKNFSSKCYGTKVARCQELKGKEQYQSAA